MADPKEPLQFADEHIKEIEQKLAGNSHAKESAQDIFARINGIPPVAPEKTEAPQSNPLMGTVTPSAEAQTPQSQVVIKNLRTFQGDVAEAMKKQGTSFVSIALAEKKREEENQKKSAEAGLRKTNIIPAVEIQKSGSLKSTLPPQTPIQKIIAEPIVVEVNHEARNRVIIIVSSIVFILLGIGAVGAFYVFQKNTPVVVAEPAENKTIVAYNKASAVTVDTATQDELFETLNRQRREKVLGDNETLYISLVTTATDNSLVPISPARFFKIFENSAPASLIRAFGTKMMFGLYKTSENEPFLLIRVDSFDNAFTGMLEWESTINKDIGTLFSKNLLPITEVVPTTDSTPGTTTVQKTLNVDLANGSVFEDETIKNKDIRILRNKQGGTILLYSFIDKNTLLITGSQAVLEVMVNKVADQKLVR